MKRALVTGSSGFIGGHLVKRLKSQGYYVIGADVVKPKYEESYPDKFHLIDLRDCASSDVIFAGHRIDEVYNLACLMGGMGWIGDPSKSFDIIVGSSAIVTNMIDGCVRHGAKKSFYASSACVYNEHKQSDEAHVFPLREEDAYPASPDLVYGWQKLFSEQMYEASKKEGLDVRVARFHNVYGTHTIYDGGKEKAPAALCRKVSKAYDGDEIEIWGSGSQVRSFMYVDDCLEGVQRLMESIYDHPLNIGSDEAVTINEMARMLFKIARKDLRIKNVNNGLGGVASRNSDNTKCEKVLGWKPRISLFDGLKLTYNWINSQIHPK